MSEADSLRVTYLKEVRNLKKISKPKRMVKTLKTTNRPTCTSIATGTSFASVHVIFWIRLFQGCLIDLKYFVEVFISFIGPT